ncbi:choline kinase [Agrilactobacillus composti DSM 18527 = JCM 14202]|uniref:phosphotransferase n=1 Tax=Agrilactobacillus composti TaxID=398555 RepID=UPI00042DEBE2|nr:phosphotransferase [Agrilactobacillus composti]GAF38258.1 choline kinase [Agrilactobacillus composti DSM 18527 = JCM 14202]
MIEKILTYLKVKEIPKLLGLQPTVKVTFLAQGEYNQNFLLTDGQNPQQFVLRFNYGSQLPIDNQIRYEYQALQWLQRSHVTPKVYYVDDSQDFFDQGLLIEAFLPGRPLDYHQDLTVAARIFGRIHRLKIDRQAQQQFLAEKQDILAARVRECTTLLTPVFASKVIAQPVQQLLADALDNCRQHVAQQRFFTDLDLWAVNNTEVNSHNFIIGQQVG